MKEVDWYFDVISPFSYLALQRLRELPEGTVIRYRPVLFAGLLDHWGQKGPAEVVPKRVWTYRWCTWLAAEQGLPFRFPATHPFNPLSYLRLCIAAGNSARAVNAVFDALWTTAADPDAAATLAGVAETMDVPLERLADPAVKQALREEPERAAARGVFGVPTLAVADADALFWGLDAIPFAAACLRDPDLLSSEEMKRVSNLPSAAQRR
ncbi:MAG: 2-hydroxychromene-2-carboxylate isomerase [Ectothiorhodospiraceae bacterium]|nr:2-hydroxychromene-2-carboxylate isomerase [Ectothiorhodospiraceae bacterium]